METFRCEECDKDKPVQHEGGTGYASFGENREKKVCYECCAKIEWRHMQMTGQATLYLHQHESDCVCPDGPISYVSNWPNTLKFPVQQLTEGRHNIARTRCDVWFKDRDNRTWWGVSYGDWTQLVHCRRLKDRSLAS